MGVISDWKLQDLAFQRITRFRRDDDRRRNTLGAFGVRDRPCRWWSPRVQRCHADSLEHDGTGVPFLHLGDGGSVCRFIDSSLEAAKKHYSKPTVCGVERLGLSSWRFADSRLVCGISVNPEREPFIILNVFMRLTDLSNPRGVVANRAYLITCPLVGVEI